MTSNWVHGVDSVRDLGRSSDDTLRRLQERSGGARGRSSAHVRSG